MSENQVYNIDYLNKYLTFFINTLDFLLYYLFNQIYFLLRKKISLRNNSYFCFFIIQIIDKMNKRFI